MMAQFNLTIQTRRLYPGPEESAFAEAYAALIFTEYDDEDGLSVTLATDEARENVPIDMDDQTNDGPIEARKSIMAVPSEGMAGTFFEVKIEKVIPTDGDFRYHRMQMQAIPETMDHEHVAGGAVAQTGGLA
jgi:hypothetical protein